MKKATTFVLILALLVALAGCSVDTGTQSKESQQAGVGSDWLEGTVCVEDVFIADLFSYEDYCAFMETDPELPKNFVYYEDGLDGIGAFNSLVIVNPNRYVYTVIDKIGKEISISFEEKDYALWRYPEKQQNVTVQSGTFHKAGEDTFNKLPSSVDGGGREYIHGDGIAYGYASDRNCYSVTWIEGDWMVRVYGDKDPNHLYNYPMDEGETFLTRLLTVETAKEAVREFNEKAFGD